MAETGWNRNQKKWWLGAESNRRHKDFQSFRNFAKCSSVLLAELIFFSCNHWLIFYIVPTWV